MRKHTHTPNKQINKQQQKPHAQNSTLNYTQTTKERSITETITENSLQVGNNKGFDEKRPKTNNGENTYTSNRANINSSKLILKSHVYIRKLPKILKSFAFNNGLFIYSMLFHVHLDFHTAPKLDNELMLWGLMASEEGLTLRYQTEVLPLTSRTPYRLVKPAHYNGLNEFSGFMSDRPTSGKRGQRESVKQLTTSSSQVKTWQRPNASTHGT